MSDKPNGGGPEKGFLHPRTVETIIGCLIGLLAFFGWAVWNDIKELGQENQKFREKVYADYVQKRDYEGDIDRIYDQLTQISKKLDQISRDDRVERMNRNK